MSWKEILKADEMLELRELIGKEGDLEDIKNMVDEKFNVKSKILNSSFGGKHLTFDLKMFVYCKTGTKDNPSTTEKFTVNSIGRY